MSFISIGERHYRRLDIIVCLFVLLGIGQVFIAIDIICLLMILGCSLSHVFEAQVEGSISGAESRTKRTELYCKVPFVWSLFLHLKSECKSVSVLGSKIDAVIQLHMVNQF